ncbi:hypothetical protein FOCC_FOCC002104, partial [Frankliniella occidentalis]
MRCKLAMETLSHTVASDIAVIFLSSKGKLLKNCITTAKLISDLDLFLDLSQGQGPKDKEKPVQRCFVTTDSIHHVMWRRMITEMQKWKFIRKFGKNKGQTHVPICLSGWIDNIRLWNHLHKNFGFDALNLRCLNQDPIENFFAVIRSTNGSNRSPTVQQFSASMKTAIINNLSSAFLRGKNCQDEYAELLSDFSEMIGQKRVESSSSPSPRIECSVIRGHGELPSSAFRSDSRFKCSRQDPAMCCTKIAHKVLSKVKEACSVCRSKLLVPADEANSDYLLQQCLQLTALNRHLSDMRKKKQTNISSYADLLQLLTSKEETIRNVYASPHLINTFLLCRRNFLQQSESIIFHSDVHEKTVQICSSASFDWLCEDHQLIIRPMLINFFVDFFLENICQKINQITRDTEKLKAKKSALRNIWRSRVQNHADGRTNAKEDQEWEDVESLLCYLDGMPEASSPVTSSSANIGSQVSRTATPPPAQSLQQSALFTPVPPSGTLQHVQQGSQVTPKPQRALVTPVPPSRTLQLVQQG